MDASSPEKWSLKKKYKTISDSQLVRLQKAMVLTGHQLEPCWQWMRCLRFYNGSIGWPASKPRGGDFAGSAASQGRLCLGKILAIGSELPGRHQPARWACRGQHGWLVATQRGTGRSTSPAHLTRLCSFGRGHVCLPCHNWLAERSRVERDVACSRHATLPMARIRYTKLSQTSTHLSPKQIQIDVLASWKWKKIPSD